MTRAPQDLGFFRSEQYSRPSRSDRRRYEADRRRRRRRRLLVPLVVLVVLGVAGAGALYGGRSLLGRFGGTPDYQGQGSGSSPATPPPTSPPPWSPRGW